MKYNQEYKKNRCHISSEHSILYQPQGMVMFGTGIGIVKGFKKNSLDISTKKSWKSTSLFSHDLYELMLRYTKFCYYFHEYIDRDLYKDSAIDLKNENISRI